MAPPLAKTSPSGPEWLQEVNFDVWQAQDHIEQGEATIYSKSGTALTSARCFMCAAPAFLMAQIQARPVEPESRGPFSET